MKFFPVNNRIFHDVFSRARVPSESAQFGRSPSVDWLVLCTTFALLLFGAITAGVIMYGRVENENIFLSEKKESAASLPLDRFKLERTVLFYEKKQEQFNALKQKPLSTADPYVSPPEKK